MPASKIKKRKPLEDNSRPLLIKSEIAWDDAYPYLEETFRVDKTTVEVKRYFSCSDERLERFLYDVIRSNMLPQFIKSNFKKIKKYIEKEIVHRDKLYEKLTKEQVIAFESYFKDEDYFDRCETNEYFTHELESVYINYMKAYLDTRLYESRSRSFNRKRKAILEKYDISDLVN